MSESANTITGGVLQFAKAPVPGRVKTRMQPVLSPAQSQALHEALCQHAATQCSQVGEWHYRLCVTEPGHGFWSGTLARYQTWPQAEGDLGHRMAQAIGQALGQGWPWVVVIGSDCPELDRECIRAARDQLTAHDLVLAPAHDGGYALIAMTRPLSVFDGIDWGTERVLAQTLALADQQGLSVALLPPVSDIDRPDDLAQLTQWPALRQFVR